MARWFRFCWLAVTTVLLFAACGTREPIQGQPTTALDRKLSTFAWIEQGDLVTFVVGTRAARYRENSPFLPIEIALANTGVKTLLLTRESFTLVDENGARYPVATPRELLEGYDFLDLDRDQLAELELIVHSKFAAYTRYQSKFSPTHMSRSDLAGGALTVRDLVSLPKFGYIMDYLYFPAPATGVLGHKFEIFLESESLPQPIFVKFEIK